MWLYEPERLCRDGFRRTIEFSRAARDRRSLLVKMTGSNSRINKIFLQGAKKFLSIRNREIDISPFSNFTNRYQRGFDDSVKKKKNKMIRIRSRHYRDVQLCNRHIRDLESPPREEKRGDCKLTMLLRFIKSLL